jgi:1-deoxy-D-xylulose-5-phosphate reductoisomerase
MKKRINILGSTGSIGNTTLKIISSNLKLFSIETLMANKNFSKIQKQINQYNPKNFVVTNYDTYLKVAKKFKKKKIKIYNNFNSVKINKKIDITVAAIPGLAGLEPTLKFTKKSKILLIANKESVICGWELINNIVKKYKVK